MGSAKNALVEMAARSIVGLERLIRPRSEAGNATAVTSVVVLEYMLRLGNCVHMTPVFEALKRRRPEMTVTVATRGMGLELLRHSPFVDHLIETPDPLTDPQGAVRSLKAQLAEREVRPECALTGVSDQRTKIALLGLEAVDGWRGGFTVVNELYQRPMEYDWTKSLIGNNLRLAAMLGYSGEVLEPRVFYTGEDVAAAREMLEPARAGGRPVLVVVSQNSGGQRTGWHTDRFVRVIRHAQEELGYGVVYVGTAADVAAIEALREEVGGGISVAGKTSVSRLAALLALSDMVVSLDTGTMHVGRAVGVPMVVLGPSWQKPLEWLPLGKEWVRILRGEDRESVPENYQLDEIDAEAVVRALDEMTELYPASERAREARMRRGFSEIDLLP